MCCSCGKRLIDWLHELQKDLNDFNHVITIIGNDLGKLSEKKLNYRDLYDFLKGKGLESYDNTIHLIKKEYRGETFVVPFLTEDQENKVIQTFDELVKKSKITMCAHNSFILAKCLELIGLHDMAQECKEFMQIKSIDKLNTSENRWQRFISPDS